MFADRAGKYSAAQTPALLPSSRTTASSPRACAGGRIPGTSDIADRHRSPRPAKVGWRKFAWPNMPPARRAANSARLRSSLLAYGSKASTPSGGVGGNLSHSRRTPSHLSRLYCETHTPDFPAIISARDRSGDLEVSVAFGRFDAEKHRGSCGLHAEIRRSGGHSAISKRSHYLQGGGRRIGF